MKTIIKTVLLSAITLGLTACNGGGSNGKNTPAPIKTIESGWELTDSGKVYIGGIYEGNFYGAGYNGDYAYGVVSETDGGLHLMLTTNDGVIADELNQSSNDRYALKKYTLERNRFGYHNRNMFIKNANWNSHETTAPLKVNDQGEFFNLVMNDTGCSVDGTISFKDNNLFVIDGEAVGCIDGAYQGKVKAVGTMKGQLLPEQIEMRMLSTLFVYEGDGSITDRYSPVRFIIRNH